MGHQLRLQIGCRGKSGDRFGCVIVGIALFGIVVVIYNRLGMELGSFGGDISQVRMYENAWSANETNTRGNTTGMISFLNMGSTKKSVENLNRGIMRSLQEDKPSQQPSGSPGSMQNGKGSSAPFSIPSSAPNDEQSNPLSVSPNTPPSLELSRLPSSSSSESTTPFYNPSLQLNSLKSLSHRPSVISSSILSSGPYSTPRSQPILPSTPIGIRTARPTSETDPTSDQPSKRTSAAPSRKPSTVSSVVNTPGQKPSVNVQFPDPIGHTSSAPSSISADSPMSSQTSIEEMSQEDLNNQFRQDTPPEVPTPETPPPRTTVPTTQNGDASEEPSESPTNPTDTTSRPSQSDFTQAPSRTPEQTRSPTTNGTASPSTSQPSVVETTPSPTSEQTTQRPVDDTTEPPSGLDTDSPGNEPTMDPTSAPVNEPTEAPFSRETVVPTEEPTVAPTEDPTIAPVNEPTEAPFSRETVVPTEEPTIAPTGDPTIAPVNEPTKTPFGRETVVPTDKPTVAPTGDPTIAPVNEPTEAPFSRETVVPTDEPTVAPTGDPTIAPVNEPTEAPFSRETAAPVNEPTTERPMDEPTEAPSSRLTLPPITDPTFEPSSLQPTSLSTPTPSIVTRSPETTLTPTVRPVGFRPTIPPFSRPSSRPRLPPAPTLVPNASSPSMPGTTQPTRDPTVVVHPTVPFIIRPTRGPTSPGEVPPFARPTVSGPTFGINEMTSATRIPSYNGPPIKQPTRPPSLQSRPTSSLLSSPPPTRPQIPTGFSPLFPPTVAPIPTPFPVLTASSPASISNAPVINSSPTFSPTKSPKAPTPLQMSEEETLQVSDACLHETSDLLEIKSLSSKLQIQRELAASNSNCASDTDNRQRCTVDYTSLPGDPNAQIRDECGRLNAQYVEISYGAKCVSSLDGNTTGLHFGSNSGSCMVLSCLDNESIPLFRFLLGQDFDDRIESSELPQECIIRTVWVVTPQTSSETIATPIAHSLPKNHSPRIGDFLPQSGSQQFTKPGKHTKQQAPQIPPDISEKSAPNPEVETPKDASFIEHGIATIDPLFHPSSIRNQALFFYSS
ncbi:PT repeat-containing protein [Nitzschia inconspicua]|uniref:PT repeat-containing protein n=1 Tax=Nitzschia inconspicua TaxID=303405 RepID=A0A9K3KSX4_9STRA|nr:PT repeat-containing protein [Nitzschia inconspicua]